MKKKEIAAFITVEYTLLLPILIMMYGFLIYMGLFMYNRCILQTNAYLLNTESVESIEKNGILKIQEIEEQKILLAENVSFQIGMQQGKMHIKGAASMSNPFYKAGIGKEYWELSVYSESDVINPVNILRLCKAATRALGKAVEEGENVNESATGVY